MAPIGAQVTIATASEVEIDITATLLLASGYNIEQVRQAVQQQLENYLLSVRQEWDTNISATGVEYAANVYVARITAAIVGATGVVNVNALTVNGENQDIELTETGTVQQIPVLGTVTLSAQS